MESQLLEQRIVACARSWRGTRFAHQGRRKATARDAGAVDCLGLLVGVARELSLPSKAGGLLHSYDRVDYSKSPDAAQLQQNLSSLLHEKYDIKAGYIGFFMLDGSPQHLAIFSEYAPDTLGMIHAYAPARAVVEHRLDALWHKRLVSVYGCE